MSKIKVTELIGSNIAVSMQLGDILYKKLIDLLAQNESISIDFGGIDTYATPFFNASIGRLLKDYDIIELKQKLSFPNISEGGRNLLNKVIANAIEFYKNPILVNQIVNDLVEE